MESARDVVRQTMALVLAGGRGSRLKALTDTRAKPSVYFGGKFRIIDFALSNCVNSGIKGIGVVTQYKSHSLLRHLQAGWSFFRNQMNEYIDFLPASQRLDEEHWYQGTADAIYQNIDIIKDHKPKYVLILAGDHIYKMDYSTLILDHIKMGGPLTVACIPVPKEQAKGFGVMNVNSDNLVTDFVEKPADPPTMPDNPYMSLASMGIYVFTWSKLRKYLIDNENDEGATKDFGKNIIPAMLENKEKMVAYHFDGYWKDVGTIDSLWEANMDVLDPKVPLDLLDDNWKIYSRNPVMPPHYAGPSSQIQNSMVAEGCEIYGMVDFAVLFAGVVIEEGAIVRDSIIMPNTIIKKGAVIEYSIVGENCVIGEGAHIGERPELIEDKSQWGVAVIGHNVNVSDKAVAPPKAMISKDI